jgi:hypothetical protein
MDYMISMFIDDELGIDDKIEFVEKVHGDRVFRNETIELLHQDKLIRSEVVDRVPEVELKARKRLTFRSILRPVRLLAPALAAAVIILFFFIPSQMTTSIPYRFVIYDPDASQVEITGSFTKWRKLPMNRMGSSGYWEATLDLHHGEHRFTYILDDERRFADPTILTREHDDFGGENSILLVGL